MTKPNSSLAPWGRVYVAAIALFGVGIIAHSAAQIYSEPIGWRWLILALLTLISGSATVKLPSVPATISISETFVFTSVLLFGAAAGTLTVTLDALVISLWLAWRGHPFYRIAFNVCALPASLWVGAQLYYLIGDVSPLYSINHPVEITRLLQPLLVFTIVYFLLNSWLIAFAISLEKRLSPIRIWKDNFAWLSLNYFGGASLAALLVSYTRNIDYTYLAVLPLLAILYFTFAMSMGRVEDANRHLSQLNALYMSTIETLAMAIDAKDQITHGHIRRVQRYAVGLARKIGIDDTALISAIEAASLLHDMGKLAVPEYILNKPGRLTAAEFEKMKLHASVGADILSAIDFPYPVVPIVRHHHENWDGTGYPDGLKGSEIPIGARILSVVDCFDALTSDRPYRPRLGDAEAIRILLERRGSMYDPLVVDAFVRVHAEIAPDIDELITRRDGLSAITRGSVGSTEFASTDSRLDDISASTEEMLVLYDLARTLTAHLDLADAADIIAKHLRRIVPASTTVFYTYDTESDELIAAHATGENAAHIIGLRIPRGQRLTGWVAANRQTILNSDPILDLGEAARSLAPRLRSCLSTPLAIGTNLVGVLTVYSTRRDAFTEDHKRVIEVVGRQVSQTVKSAVDFERERTSSLRDQLTGLPNLQHLERFIAAEMGATGGPSVLSIIFADVESLETINRRYGRAVGDQTLAFVADSIRRVLRGADVLFRYGNDEFVALLVQTDAPAAQAVAERIVDRLRSSKLPVFAAEEMDLSLTLGIATAPVDGTTLPDLVDVARQREKPTRGPVARPPSVH